MAQSVQYQVAVDHQRWLRQEVQLLSSAVEQQQAWNRRLNQFLEAQGNEVVRLGAVVARLEQGIAMKFLEHILLTCC